MDSDSGWKTKIQSFKLPLCLKRINPRPGSAAQKSQRGSRKGNDGTSCLITAKATALGGQACPLIPWAERSEDGAQMWMIWSELWGKRLMTTHRLEQKLCMMLSEWANRLSLVGRMTPSRKTDCECRAVPDSQLQPTPPDQLALRNSGNSSQFCGIAPV